MQNQDNQENRKSTPAAVIIGFWLYVGLPLSWGVWSTIKKAMALFN